MALVTTFATTPLTTWLYPPWYQALCEGVRAGELNWDGTPTGQGSREEGSEAEKVATKLSNVSVMLRLESLPALFAFITLFSTEKVQTERKVHKSKLENIAEDSTLVVPRERPVKVHGIRVVELTQRTSAVMQVSEVDHAVQSDPILKVFRTFGKLNRLAVSTALTVAPLESFAEAVTEKVKENHSDLLLLPWAESSASDLEEPVDGKILPVESNPSNAYVKTVLSNNNSNVAILIDRGFGGEMERPALSRVQSVASLRQRTKQDNLVNPVADPSHHIFFPFFGGEDDRVALRLVLQLCRNSTITATLVHVIYEKTEESNVQAPEQAAGGAKASNTSLTQSTLDAPDQTEDTTLFTMLRDSLPADLSQSVVFQTVTANNPLDYILERAKEELGTTKNNAGDIFVTGARVADAAVRRVIRTEFLGRGEGHGNAAVLGEVAEAVLASGVKASALVVRARN